LLSNNSSPMLPLVDVPFTVCGFDHDIRRSDGGEDYHILRRRFRAFFEFLPSSLLFMKKGTISDEIGNVDTRFVLNLFSDSQV
jgi:hypothetical protein